MDIDAKQLFVAAAVAGMLCSVPLASTRAWASDPTAACTEHNSCKGMGHCAGVAAGKQHDCAGKNDCQGNVVSKATKAECDSYGGDWQG